MIRDYWSKFIAKLKCAHRSWTAWFALVGIPALEEGLPYIKDNLPQLQPYMPEAIYNHTTIIVMLCVVALRFKTTKSMADK